MVPMLKQKKSHSGNRFLIGVTVLGSAGPIRFVVNEDEHVGSVINTALKSYAREGRLPILGSDIRSFVLYCPVAGVEALSPWETIGSIGVRNFTLCKKPETANSSVEGEKSSRHSMSRKGSGCWRAWFNKSLSLKVPSH